MIVRGTVISVSAETDVKKNGGGSYKGWELIYKSDNGDVRTIAKPVQGLRFNAALKTILGELQAGDEFTLEQEKNTAGFYDVKSIVKGWGNPQIPAQQPAQVKREDTVSNNYQASSYPTKDERAATQQHIIRQSSLAQANATLAIGGKAVKPDDVLKVAYVYVAWVLNQKTGQEAIVDLKDDIPY